MRSRVLKYLGNRPGFNISTEDLKEWERLLLKDGTSKTIVGMYFRTFRVIWNVCEKKESVTRAIYPFGKGDDKVTISRGATQKSSYLTVEQMTELYNCFLEKRYSEECLNGHREFIVEHKDLEITNIRHDNYYRQIAESYLKEVYDFIKQCEVYIG